MTPLQRSVLVIAAAAGVFLAATVVFTLITLLEGFGVLLELVAHALEEPTP